MLNKRKKIPDAELDIMLIIWREDRRMTRAEIEAQVNQQRPLAATTVLTFLARLTERGFLGVEKIGKTNYYSVRISQEEYLRQEGRYFLEKLCGGSVVRLVASLYEDHALTDGELSELRDFLDRTLPRQE